MEAPSIHSSTRSSLKTQLTREAEAMAKYAYAHGIKVPDGLVEALEPWLEERGTEAPHSRVSSDAGGLRELAQIHERLAQLISPATPRTILLLAEEEAKSGFLRKFGPLPIIRQMMVVSCVFAAVFIGLSLSDQVNEDTITKTPLSGSGSELLLTTLFLMAAAGLGASFAALFKANRFIVEGTFDPKHESTYWVKLVLGLSAGLMLAELIPFEKNGSMPVLAKPTLAMLGGYSVDVVYRILNRLSEAIGSFVRGEPKEMIAQSIKTNQSKFDEQLTQHRLRYANTLVKLQQQVTSGLNGEDLQRHLDGLIEEVISSDRGKGLAPLANGGKTGLGQGGNRKTQELRHG